MQKFKKIGIYSHKYKNGTKAYWIDLRGRGFEKNREFFETKSAAQSRALELEARLLKEGAEGAVSMLEDERVEAQQCLQQLKAKNENFTLTQAVDFFLTNYQPEDKRKKFNDCIEDYLDTKRTGNNEDYIRAQRSALNVFGRDSGDSKPPCFGDCEVHLIQPDAIRSWLKRKNWQPLNRDNYLRDLSMFFNWAIDEQLCKANPIDRVRGRRKKRRNSTGKMPGIYTVEEVFVLLQTAAAHPELEILAVIAFGNLAGLRTCEMKRMTWSSVKLNQKKPFIAITADVVKKSAEIRNVTILPILKAWLELIPEEKRKGKVWPTNFRKKMETLLEFAREDEEIKKGGLLQTWPKNVMRHNFASYHYVKFESAEKTRKELGQNTPSVLFTHYRQVVDPEAADKYWQMFPSKG